MRILLTKVDANVYSDLKFTKILFMGKSQFNLLYYFQKIEPTQSDPQLNKLGLDFPVRNRKVQDIDIVKTFSKKRERQIKGDR